MVQREKFMLGIPQPASIGLKVFLFHASEDKTFVKGLYTRLQSDGLAPWLDSEMLLPGQEWDREVAAAVHSCDVVLVRASRAAVQKSGYVQKEIRYALDGDERPEGEVFIVPVRIDACEMSSRDE